MAQWRLGDYPTFAAPVTPYNVPAQRCPVPAEQASHRILIMRVGSNGDILMGTPLLSALREALPNAHITWLVEKPFVQCIDANPYLDQLLVWDSMYWKRQVRRAAYPIWINQCLKFQGELRRHNFDVFISFQPEEWPLLARFGTGAKHRIGVFDTLWEYSGQTRTSEYTRLYTAAYTRPQLPPHRTDQYLLPLEALGLPLPSHKRMSLGFTREDADAVDAYLQTQGVSATDRLIVLAPTTTWPSRCWPAERYVELGNRLTNELPGARIVVIGSKSEKERPVVEQVAAGLDRRPVEALGGVLTFRQMSALLHRAELAVSGDTGPMHVAAAVGARYLALFGPTPIAGRAPLYLGRGRTLSHPVPCGPCDREFCKNKGEDYLLCMRLITVNEAFDAAMALLAPTYSPAPVGGKV